MRQKITTLQKIRLTTRQRTHLMLLHRKQTTMESSTSSRSNATSPSGPTTRPNTSGCNPAIRTPSGTRKNPPCCTRISKISPGIFHHHGVRSSTDPTASGPTATTAPSARAGTRRAILITPSSRRRTRRLRGSSAGSCSRGSWPRWEGRRWWAVWCMRRFGRSIC